MLMRTEQRYDQLYEQAYTAKSRLFQRLHAEEDGDVTCIYENLMDIAAQMSMAMFDSGVQYARRFPEEIDEP